MHRRLREDQERAVLQLLPGQHEDVAFALPDIGRKQDRNRHRAQAHIDRRAAERVDRLVRPDHPARPRLPHLDLLARVDTGFIVANGMVFSPDGKTLIFGDSTSETFYRYDATG
jgi:hypothetical protein